MQMPRQNKQAEPAQKKRGRPLSLVEDEKTLNTLATLGRIQCTSKEAAAVLQVSEPTLFDFFKRSKKARETWDSNRDSGKASLRRHQFKMAETNPTMAIWLGKQYLSQHDKHEHGGIPEQPLQMVVKWAE